MYQIKFYLYITISKSQFARWVLHCTGTASSLLTPLNWIRKKQKIIKLLHNVLTEKVSKLYRPLNTKHRHTEGFSVDEQWCKIKNLHYF